MSTEDDQVWFKELVEDQQHDLVKKAIWQLRDQNAANDLVQDVFVTAWEKRHELRAADDPAAWLRKALIFKLCNRGRLSWFRRERSTQHDALPEAADMRERSAADLSARADLCKVFKGISPERVYIFIEVAVCNRSYVELAEELGISDEAVRKKYKGVQNKVRKRMPTSYLAGDHGDE